LSSKSAFGVGRSMFCEADCPRGLERPTAPAEAAGPKKECAGEKSTSPPAAPQSGGTLGLEMAEVVSAWPKLPPEIRVAILTLLRAAKIG
jgi:hypothetical protein